MSRFIFSIFKNSNIIGTGGERVTILHFPLVPGELGSFQHAIVAIPSHIDYQRHHIGEGGVLLFYYDNIILHCACLFIHVFYQAKPGYQKYS